MAFTISATSGRTGRGYDFDFEKEPTEIDIDEAIVAADAEAEAAEVAAQGPVESGVKTGFRDFGPALTTRPLAGVFGMLDKAADVVANVTGTQKGGGFGTVAGFMEDVNTEAERVIPTNPENKIANTIGSGVSQGLGLLTGMGAMRAAGAGAKAMTAFPVMIGAASGAGEGLDTAKEFGIDTPEKALAMGALFGGLEGVTEKLGGFGSEAATRALVDGFKGEAGKVLAKAAQTVLSEGVEENLAGIGQDLLTRAFADEDPANPGFTRKGVKLPELTDLEKRKLEFIGGAAGGAVFAGAQMLAGNEGSPQRTQRGTEDGNQGKDLGKDSGGNRNAVSRAETTGAAGAVESGVAETFGGSMGRTTLPDGRRVAFDLAALSPDQVAAMTQETLEAAMGAGLVRDEGLGMRDEGLGMRDPAVGTQSSPAKDPAQSIKETNARAKRLLARTANGEIDREQTRRNYEEEARRRGLTMDQLTEELAAENIEAVRDLFRNLNDRDTVEWIDGNGKRQTGVVEVGLDGVKRVRNTTEGDPSEDFLYHEENLGFFAMVGETLKVTGVKPRRVRGATGAGGPQGTTTAGATGVDRTSAREIDRLAGQLAEPPKERTLLGNDPAIGSRAQVQMGQAVPQAPNRPTLPPDPTGSEDILNWLTLNPILAPRKGEATEGGEYDWREAGEFPPKYRSKIMRNGRPNIDERAQAAFEEGLINEPTPDALVEAIRSAIDNRETLGRVQSQQEANLAAAEAARVRFDEEQEAMRDEGSGMRDVVDADALVRGDRIAVGKSVYEVMDIQMDEDGRTLGYDVVDADGQVIGVDVSEGGQMVGEVTRGEGRVESGEREDLPFARGGMRAGQGAGVLAESRDATETDRQKAEDTTGLIRDQASFRRAWPGKYRGGWSVSDAPDTESARSASRLAGALGVRLVWFDDGGAAPSDSLRGWRGSQPRTIYLNKSLATNKAGRESLGPLNVAAHEIMHVLEMEQPDVYADLLAWLKPRLNEGKIREVLARLQYDPVRDNLDAEAVAHLAGELALEPAFYEQVLKDEPGLARRIAAVIGAVLERLKRAFLSGLDLQLSAGGQMTLEEMLNAQGRTEEAEVMRRVTEALRALRGGEVQGSGTATKSPGLVSQTGAAIDNSQKADAVLPAIESTDSFQSAPPARATTGRNYATASQRQAQTVANLRGQRDEMAAAVRELRGALEINSGRPASGGRWISPLIQEVRSQVESQYSRPAPGSPLVFKGREARISENGERVVYGPGPMDSSPAAWVDDPLISEATLNELNERLLDAEAALYLAEEAEGGRQERLDAKESAAEWARRTRAAEFAALLNERDEESRNAASVFVAKVWGAYAARDEAFQFGKTTSKDAADIAKAVSLPGKMVTATEGNGTLRFSGPSGYLDIHDTDTARPYIRSSEAGSKGKKGGGGTQLYQAALDWIHNNGKRIKDDPGGLTGINAIRRTSNFFSSALRWGTAKHLKPHSKQGMKWVKSDMRNIAALATTELDNASRAVAEVGSWSYDFRRGTFLDETGAELAFERIERAAVDANPAESGIGVSTLERAIITRSALDAFQRGEAEGIVSEIEGSRELPERLTGIAYAKGTRESEFGERVQADERMSPGMREANPSVFEVRPQQRQHDEARAIIRTMGLAEALVHFSRDDTGLERSVRIAGLMQVAQNYDVRHLAAARRGDDAGMAEADRELEKAIEAKVELEILGNETGRALAMYNTWARLSPNGMLERFGRNLRKKRRESLETDTGATTAEVTGAINEAEAEVKAEEEAKVQSVLDATVGPVTPESPQRQKDIRAAIESFLKDPRQNKADLTKALIALGVPKQRATAVAADIEGRRKSLAKGLKGKGQAKAEEKLNQAQKSADSILSRLAKIHADPQGWAKKGKGAEDAVRALYRKHIKEPMGREVFAAELQKLGVDESLANRLAGAAQLEIDAMREIDRIKTRERLIQKVMTKLAPKKHAQRRAQRMPKIIETLMEMDAAGLLDGGVTERQVLDAYGKAFDLPELTPEQTRKLTAMAGALNKLPEGVLRQNKAREFLNEMALIEGIPASDAILSMWYANILSGIGTQGVNVWGNGTMALLKGVAAMAASPREARRYLKAARTMGLRQGLREGAAALRKGVGHKTNLKWDEAQRLNGLELISSQGGPKNLSQWIAWVGSVGGLTRYVFRLLGAMDLMFYYSAHEGMTALATARTIRKDRKLKPGTRAFEAEFIRQMGGDESQWAADLDQARQELRAAGQAVDERLVNRRAYELRVERRSDRVREQASRWADRLTFQQDPEGFAREISGAIKRIQNITPLGVPIGRLLVPFNKIVSNVFENGIDFTPIGIARAAVGGHLTDRSKWGTMDVVERRERALSGVIGLGFASLFYALTKAWDDDDDVDAPFRLYGPGPGSAAGRAAMPAGWRPYSFKWGDKYVSYAETPMGPMLAAVGALLDVERYSTSYGKKTAGDRAKMAIQAALRSFSSQGVLSTVQDGIEVLSGDTWKDPTSLLGNPVRGVVPASGLVRDIGELFDNTKISDDDLYGAMVKDVPVVRNYGTFPDRNWRGEPLTQAGLPVVRRFVTKQKLDKESAWMGRNRLRVSMIEPHILVGQYTGIPEAAQGLPLVESYARRGLQLTALENGAFTRPQWDRFSKRAGELTAERVKVLRETYEARFPEGRVPVEMQEDLQNHVNRIVQAARKTAMLEEMGRVR